MSARQRIALDGPWHFYFDEIGKAKSGQLPPPGDWRRITVPMPWQAQFEELRNRGGVGWFQRTLIAPAVPDDCVAILHFGAVDYHATVWVNGSFVCEHEGGYLPFEADITAYLAQGENEILVRVIDPDGDRDSCSSYAFSQIPHGKQSWYGQTSGIWQSVWLEVRHRSHLCSLKLTPDLAHNQIAVEARLADTAIAGDLTACVSVFGPDDALVNQTHVDVAPSAHLAVTLTLEKPAIPWSPDEPALYRVHLALKKGSKKLDEIEDSCGFRTVEARDGRIYLNGRPLYLRGALDQAYYPDTIYTPPSLALLERQLRQAKDLGFNCLRCHIKIEDPRYYALADRMGMLIWAELPNWMHWTPAAATRAEETFEAMVARDWNHPSIIAWTLINEDWGTDLVNDDEHRQWLVQFFERAKALDPTRLIVDNSPCHPNAHVVSDIDDYHHYRVIPDNAADWTQWVRDFATRPDWTWIPAYSHLRQADAPLVVSEFGNWGLPDPRRLSEDGRSPWWFDAGSDWGEGIVTPQGLEQRFAGWRLDRVFGTFDAFLQASQEQMAHSLAYEIGAIRRHPAIGGYVVTELTDVHWEANGIMDFQRNVKAGVTDRIAPVNRDCAILIDPEKWSAHPGETVHVELLAVDGTGPATNGRLRWRTEWALGEVAAPGGLAEIRLPDTEDSCEIIVWAEWEEGERLLAINQIELACIVIQPWDDSIRVDAGPDMADALRAVGYTLAPDVPGMAPDMPGSRTLVTDHLSDPVLDQIRRGAHGVWLVDARSDAVQPAHLAFLGDQTRIVPREGTWWQGDWASSFSWLNKSGPFADLPGGPMLNMAYAEIMPRSVLTLESHRLLKQNVWAGLAVGWLQKIVGLIAYTDYGQGSIVICTMHLTPDHLLASAAARGLLRGLIELAATGGR